MPGSPVRRRRAAPRCARCASRWGRAGSPDWDGTTSRRAPASCTCEISAWRRETSRSCSAASPRRCRARCGARPMHRYEATRSRWRCGSTPEAAGSSSTRTSRWARLSAGRWRLPWTASIRRSEEHTSELQSHRDLHSFPTRRSSDLVRLDAGGGRVQLDADLTLGTPLRWQVALALDGVDPARVVAAGPAGEVSGRIEARGRGVPQLDAYGVRGDLALRGHVGPARIDRVGEVRVDVQADIQGREALVRAFTASAFGLQISAHGTASFDAVALDLDVNAPDLRVVGRAAGVLQKKPPLPLSGSAHLAAHLTGSPRAPDAQVHLRVPEVRLDGQFAARTLALDGTLHGKLAAPDGNLRLTAASLAAGQIALQSPRIDATLQWPWATATRSEEHTSELQSHS